MFDIIGKRRWYFLISAIITLPGLFFIFIAPLASKDAGLQFTIDYTGGTKWEIRFENQNVTTDQVRAVFAANGLEASVLQTGRWLPRDQDGADRPERGGTVADAASDPRPVGQPGCLVVRGSPRPRRRRGASGSAAPVASASPAPSASPSPTPTPSASPPRRSAARRRRRVAGRLAGRVATGRDRQHGAPDRRQAR